MADDETEREFWRTFMGRKSGYAPDASSRRVLERLLPVFREHAVETALELGPG